MSCSKFQHLPYLALSSIFQHLEPIYLIDLALKSELMATAIEMYHLETTRYEFKVRTGFDRGVSIKILFANSKTLTWEFHEDQTGVTFDGATVPLQVSGTILNSCARHLPSQTMVTFGPSLDSSLTAVTKYLFNLFPCNVHDINMEDHMFLELPKFIEEIRGLRCRQLLMRASSTTTMENLERVLATFHTVESLDLSCYDGEEVDISQLPHLKYVKLSDCHWLNPDTFLNLECRQMEFGDNNLNGLDLNRFIKNWLHGNDDQFESFTMSMTHFSTDDINVMITGLTLDGFDKKTRHSWIRKAPNFVIDASEGLDVLRQDGTLMVILIEQWTIHFLVCRERFPDFSLPQGQYYTRMREGSFLEAKYALPEVFASDRDIEFDSECRVEEFPSDQ